MRSNGCSMVLSVCFYQSQSSRYVRDVATHSCLRRGIGKAFRCQCSELVNSTWIDSWHVCSLLQQELRMKPKTVHMSEYCVSTYLISRYRYVEIQLAGAPRHGGNNISDSRSTESNQDGHFPGYLTMCSF
jgi:hypothetical protein